MQTIVGVLRGGPSREHEISLQSGAAMLAHLPSERYTARDIYIDKQGQWHDRGRAISPERALRQLDVAIVGLHGEYGESGEVQRLFERYGVPYTGSNPLATHQAMHKIMSKLHATEAGLTTPGFLHVERRTDADALVREAVRRFHQPVVVKPVGWGSSVGITMQAGFAPVLSAVEQLFEEGSPSVYIEEYIRGKEATVGVVEGLRGEKLYALPTVEIIPPEGDFFSYEAKYSGKTREISPGNFSRMVTEELQRLAKVMHRALNQRHYSRSDFIVTPKHIYYLETNSAAGVGLTPESLLPKSLAAIGVSFSEFLSHLINLALGTHEHAR
jgi:D-alanine-D-alanine ligase